MLLVKNIVLVKINKKYIDRKIYIYENNFKRLYFQL